VSSSAIVRAPLVAALLALTAGPARAASVLFTIAIGNNAPPSSDVEGELGALHFADDDAAAVHQLGRSLARRSFLLTIADRETQERFPDVIGEARPPSLHELTRVIQELNHELALATAAGDETSVIIFYSGHGSVGADGRAALTFLDGPLTRDELYDEVLTPLQARYVHLLVDACHAEAVVRPRDAQAQVVPLSRDAAAAYLGQATLARFPHVGAIIATTAAQQAHEWDGYQRGVFTHELLSGLRGGADVNGDGRVEYSELGAFLVAANRGVLDPRGRPVAVVRPPPLNPRTPLVDLRSATGAARLRGRPGPLGAFHVEDDRGVRVLDLRAEDAFGVELLVPAATLFVRAGDREAELQLRPGQSAAFHQLSLRPLSARPRGALDRSLRAGLFATRFGPAYYAGFVDNRADLVAVDLPPAGSPASEPRARYAPWLLGGAAALAATSALFGGVALDARRDVQRTDIAVEALAARDRYDRARYAAFGFLGAALVAAVAGLWSRGAER
jgi:hypothetical protein